MNESDIPRMLAQLLDDSRLSKSDVNFVESLSEDYEEKGHLTSSQYYRLKQVFDRFNN